MNKYMQKAIELANKAYSINEIPVGAVLVQDNKILSTSYNKRQNKYNILGHAEIDAILKAEKKLKDWRLDGCTLYVTLEPCEMCSLIIEKSRIDQVYYLIKNKNKFSTLKNKTIYIQTNDCDIISDDYKKLLKKFFEELRK